MLAPSRTDTPVSFPDWLEREDADDRVFLSAITIHEIEKGISLLEHRAVGKKTAELRTWLSGLMAAYDDKILALDAFAAVISGQLEAKAVAAGHHPGMADAAIAGIARAHDLVIVTRNMRHFLPFEVAVASPDDAAGTA